MTRFAGRVVLITGAGSGIGRVAAAMFAAEGALVVATDVDGESAQGTGRELPDALALTLDVTDVESVAAAVAQVVDRYGCIDVVVNNAMICSDEDFVDLDDAALLRELDVNLAGAMRLTQAVLPIMIDAGGGVVLNLSSVNGLQYFGNVVYSAAKAGLISFTRSVAVAHGRHGIRCNAVAPGTIATPAWRHRLRSDPTALERLARFYPLGRIGTPQDVGEALLFLASDQAGWISGAVLPVDGGLLAGNLAMADTIERGAGPDEATGTP